MDRLPGALVLAVLAAVSPLPAVAQLPGPGAETVAVVFNSADPIDAALAHRISSLLASDLTRADPGVSGSMPAFVVRLVPQDDVPRTWDPTFSLRGVVVLTPATTVWAGPGQSRNLAAQGRGIIAMGTGGARLLDTVLLNWDAWKPGWQAPDALGWRASVIGPLTTRVVTQATDESVWSSPLASSAIPGPDQPVQVSTSPLIGLDVLWPEPWQPLGGELIAREDGEPARYPIVLQGRFLQYGFEDLADERGTGDVLFVNLVATMGRF
jgi:hypothetical protein